MSDPGLNIKSEGASGGLGTDSNKKLNEVVNNKDLRNVTGHPTGFNQNNFGVMASTNGHHSLPSSGSSTPLTSKGPNFPQSATPDSMQHQGNSYPSNMNIAGPNRNSMPHMPSKSQGSGNGFDWATYPPNGRPIQPGHENGQADKSDNISDKSQFHSLPEDHHDEFVGGFFVPRGGTTHVDALNG